MTDFNYTDTTLKIGGKNIDFEDPIQKVIGHDCVVYVLLEYSNLSDKYQNQNIVAIDQHGSELWQVDPSPNSKEKNNPYTGIGIEEDQVIAYTWDGISVILDPDAGTWDNPQLSK